jgi:hypothetical protein
MNRAAAILFNAVRADDNLKRGMDVMPWKRIPPMLLAVGMIFGD